MPRTRCLNSKRVKDVIHVHIRFMSSPVRLSVVCRVVYRLSVTFVHPTQVIEIFSNVSTPFDTLATC